MSEVSFRMTLAKSSKFFTYYLKPNIIRSFRNAADKRKGNFEKETFITRKNAQNVKGDSRRFEICPAVVDDGRFEKAISLIIGTNDFEVEKSKLQKQYRSKEIDSRTYIRKLIEIHEKECNRYHALIFKLYDMRVD